MKKVCHGWKIALLAAACLSMPSLPGAPKSAPGQSGKTFAISEGGIRLALFAGAEKQLPPSLSGVKLNSRMLYSQAQLWRHAQQLACWSNARGASASLAVMCYAPPAAPFSYVSRCEDMAWRSYSEPPSEEECVRWLALFFPGVKVKPGVKLPGNGDFEWLRFPTDRPKFMLLTGRRKYADGPPVVLAVSWRNVPGADDQAWERAMANRALAARALPVERREKPSFGGARFGSYAARLAGAKKSIEGLSGWYIVETPHYIFVTNQANRKVIRQLQGDLEAARKGFQLYFPARDDAAAVGVVKVFAKRQEYLQHLPPGREWSAGLWSSATQELLVSPPGFKTDKKTAAKQIREVTLHEAFHQYIFDASGESHAAPWFNEGSAEFFERSLPQQGDFGILDAETERQLAQTVARAPGDLKDFLLLDQAGYYAGNRRLFHYRLGHALMYYLLRGAPALGEKEAADLPARYLEALRATRNGRRATERILIGLDTGKLAAQLKNFWSSRSALQRARRYRKLP